jgi:hypothetical protein
LKAIVPPPDDDRGPNSPQILKIDDKLAQYLNMSGPVSPGQPQECADLNTPAKEDAEELPAIAVTVIPLTAFDEVIKGKVREILPAVDLSTLEELVRKEAAIDGFTLGEGDLATLLCSPSSSLEHVVSWLTKAAVMHQKALRRENGDDVQTFKEHIHDLFG